MTQPFKTQHPEINELFDRYRRAPQSNVFAPLADACRKAGMLDEALDICRKGLVANPRYASGFVVQGKCFYDAERPEEAEGAFRRVLELDAANLVALKFIGIILSERGDTGAARACFEHILALDPEDRDIRRRLDEVEDSRPADEGSRNGEPSPELTETRIMRPIAPESMDADDEFEGAPITLGDDSETPDEIATITLADIYSAQGYTEKALRIYREVHRRQPDNDDLRRKISALESRAERRAVAAQAEEEAAVLAADAKALAAKEQAAAPAAAVAARSASGSRIDETRSYEQFKRWLRNVSD